MNQAHHGILALALSLVACGVLYSLRRRGGQSFLLAWVTCRFSSDHRLLENSASRHG